MTTYVHMTAEEALALATRLTAAALRVNAAKQKGHHNAYEYTTVAFAAKDGVKEAGDKIRIRVGDETL